MKKEKEMNAKLCIAKDFGKFSTNLCHEIVNIMKSTLDNIYSDEKINWDDVNVNIFTDEAIKDAAKEVAQVAVKTFFNKISKNSKEFTSTIYDNRNVQ
jgi:hypothetical protein